MLKKRIAELEYENEVLRQGYIPEFRRIAEAESIAPEAIAILERYIIPKLGEIPNRWELRELAALALEIFPKIEQISLEYGGDMDDPRDREISLERKKLFDDWNREAERILGFDRAQKVHWGS